MALILTAH